VRAVGHLGDLDRGLCREQGVADLVVIAGRHESTERVPLVEPPDPQPSRVRGGQVDVDERGPLGLPAVGLATDDRDLPRAAVRVDAIGLGVDERERCDGSLRGGCLGGLVHGRSAPSWLVDFKIVS
jgi:hypothetical protein